MKNSNVDIKLLIEIFLSIAFICIAVIYVNKIAAFQDTQQNILMRYVMVLFAAIVALFIADKTITIGTPLLTEKQSDSIFQLISYMTVSIFGNDILVYTKDYKRS